MVGIFHETWRRLFFSLAGKSPSEWATSGVPGMGSCVEIKSGNIPSLEEGGITLLLLSLSNSGTGGWIGFDWRLSEGYTHTYSPSVWRPFLGAESNSFLGLKFLGEGWSRVVCSGDCLSCRSSHLPEFKVLCKKRTNDFRGCECIMQTEVDWEAFI